MKDGCPNGFLQKMVENTLSAEEETALQDHFKQCEVCCGRLEQMAGGEPWRREVAEMLTPDDLDAALREAEIWSDADFSVDHLEPSPDANALGHLGGYDILAIIGRGGMGVVLKAFDRELKRFVALKALAPHLAHSPVARKRFAREAQAAAAVVNPHVIAIHHVQPAGRLPFLIMPLLTGESLAQRLKAHGPLELKEVLRIGMQAATGLAAAHDQGLVHRDVKPANIFLEKGVERVVITDFGLARAADDVSLTRQGVVAGTPEYMSPEQARGEGLDGRSDLFSLGCVLYEMATGVSPFRTDSVVATLRRLVDETPQAMEALNPVLPPWFIRIVERLLEKDPGKRFHSAQDVSGLLESCLAHVQHPAAAPLPASLLSNARRKGGWGKFISVGGMAMSGALGLAFLALLFWQKNEGAPGKDEPRLRGNWAVIALEEDGVAQSEGHYKGVHFQIGVKDRKLAVRTPGPDGKIFNSEEMSFVVNEAVSPGEIDFTKDGRKAFGIYRFEKDHLKLCVGLDGKTRPDDFKTKKGAQQKYYVLKKLKEEGDPEARNGGSLPASPVDVTPPKAVTKDAEKLLGWSIEQAKASGKRVLVVFGTKSCIPCRQLDGLLEEAKPILDKYLIVVPFDLDMENGAKVHERLRKKDLEGGGIAFMPWMILLDGDGKTLAKSGKMKLGEKDAVIGLPHGKEEDRRYFIQMLRDSCQGISEGELSRVYDLATALHRRIWGDKGSYSSGK